MRRDNPALGSKRYSAFEALGAVRECLPKLVARLKHDRIDDDAEDERDEGGLVR